MLPDLSKQQIQTYYDNEAVIKDTAFQVIKDMGTYGYDITFPEDLNWIYEELYAQLIPTITDLIANHNKQLLALLYTIDVSEVTIRRLANENPSRPLPEIVTDLILERELKKVITRHYYRDHGF